MSIFKGLTLPKVLYKTESKYNGEIKVVQDGDTISLKASGTTQSINPESPHVLNAFWGRLVMLLKKEEPELKNILILGLGGATIQHLVHRNFVEPNIFSVEIDKVMVDVARKHFDLDYIANHKVIVDDACRVIISPEEYGLKTDFFDVVVVDIYCGSEFPELGHSGNFISHLKKLVRSDGLIVINRIYFQEHQESVDAFLEMIETYLKDVRTYLIPGKTNADNMLIYGRV